MASTRLYPSISVLYSISVLKLRGMALVPIGASRSRFSDFMRSYMSVPFRAVSK